MDQTAVELLSRFFNMIGDMTIDVPPEGPLVDLAHQLWELVQTYGVDPADLEVDDTLMAYGLAVLQPAPADPDGDHVVMYVQQPRISDAAPSEPSTEDEDWRHDDEGAITESGLLDETMTFGHALYGREFEIGFRRPGHGPYVVSARMGQAPIFHSEGHENPVSGLCELHDMLEESAATRKGGNA